MQEILIALFVGLILGWLIEWLVDWRFWRPSVNALRRENAQLRRQLDACMQADQSQSSNSSTVPTESRGG